MPRQVGCDNQKPLRAWGIIGLNFVLAAMCSSAHALPPANDACSGAIDINATMSGKTYSSQPVNYGQASDDPGLAVSCDQSATSNFANNGVWWKFAVGPRAVRVTIAEPGTEDVAISLWTGPDCESLVQYACADAGGSTSETFGVNLNANALYWIVVSRRASSEPVSAAVVTLTLVESDTLLVPLVNDACGGAFNLNTVSLPFQSENVFPIGAATNDPGVDPACDDADLPCAAFGVWFAYTTGQRPGLLELTETGPQDVVFSIWGGPCDALAPFVCFDDGAADVVSFPAAANTAYRILVSLKNAAHLGDPATPAPDAAITLRFNFTAAAAPPLNDDCDHATPIVATPFDSGAIFTSGAADDSVVLSCSSSINAGAPRGIWFTYSTPQSPGFALIRELGPSDVIVSIWRGECGELFEEACNDTAIDGPSGWEVPLSPEENYRILVSQRTWSAYALGEAVGLSFDYVTAPPNDECAGATLLSASSLPAHFVVNNAAAGPDADPGACNSGLQGNFGVWWSFTPPISGTFFLYEAGLQDAATGIFTSGCETPASASCTGTEFGAYAMSAGVSYLIQIGSQSAATPVAPLDVWFAFFPTPPPNDECAGAIAIPGQGSFFISNRGATTSTTNASVACSAVATMHNDVWFRWIAPANGRLGLALNSNPSPPAARFAVYDAGMSGDCSVAAASPLGCGPTADQQSYPVQAGRCYLIRFASANANSIGEARLELRFASELAAIGACCTGIVCTLVARSSCTGAYHGDGTVCASPVAGAIFYSSFGGSVLDGNTGTTEGAASFPLVVNDAFTVADIVVDLSISHAFLGDLTITLAHAGRSIDLLARVRRSAATSGGSNNNLGVGSPLVPALYTFSDSAAQTIWDVSNTTAPNMLIAAGVYKPQTYGNIAPTLRSVFNGATAAGPWTLTMTDYAHGDVATLASWTLRITPGNAASCDATAQTCCRGTTCAQLTLAACPPNGTLPGIGSVLLSATQCSGNTHAMCCHADFDKSGVVAIDDIFVYLNAWFTATPFAAFAGDGLRAPTIDDIFQFLNAWFAGCA